MHQTQGLAQTGPLKVSGDESGSDRAASFFDLFAGRGADALDLNGQLAAEITVTEDFDGITTAIHQTFFAQRGFVDDRSIFKGFVEAADIDGFIDVTELDVAKTFLW